MQKPERAAVTTPKAFQTVYSKRLKSRCRPDLEEILKVSNLSTPTLFKAKHKLNPHKTVSTDHLPLTVTNPGEICPNEGDPLAKIFMIQPSNDPQTVSEESNSILPDHTSISGTGDKKRKKSQTVSPENLTINTDSESDMDDFHDSQESTENLSPQTVRGNSDNDMDTSDPIVPQNNEETNQMVKDLYGDLEQPQSGNKSVTQSKSMDNLSNTKEFDNYGSYRSEYAKEAEKPLKIKIKRVEMPANVVRRTLDFQRSENTSEEERGAQSLLLQKSLKAAQEANNRLPTPPIAISQPQENNTSVSQTFFFLPPPINSQSTQESLPSTSQASQSLLPPSCQLSPNSRGLTRWSSQKDSAIRKEILEIVNKDSTDTDIFEVPKKSTKLKHLIQQKAKSTLRTKNQFQALTDESDKDDDSEDDENNRNRRKRTKPNTPKANGKDKTATVTAKPKKVTIPPIVIDGVTSNHREMMSNLKETIQGVFSVKHTNQSTILFVNEEGDYNRVLTNIRAEKIPHHTYTQKQDKSHAFVLRGMTSGTEIEDIREDLQITYEIKAREIFLMKTKNRPLYLIVTDPAITLDYLNRNASGSGTCSESELPSPSASGRRSVTPSMATAAPTTIEEHINNSPQPAFDVSAATQVNLPLTTKAGVPRKRMKWTSELNSFIMRSYFKITKMETDLTTYRYALHRAFVEKYPELQHLTEQRIADQRRAILTKNLLAAPVVQQIRAEVLLELQGEDEFPSTENALDGDHTGVDENNTENDTNPDRDNNTQIDMADRKKQSNDTIKNQ
ncbi:unnamed protein product [Psylliodes chrysocephalus]|uniref:Uncharacterized protein n=1 Tax=Psylliodes chrysocephalus TaxID=3402493 RepID=A0A9P0CGT1_9CUCU|nr:unnamed protein product [Psylliodes chrysocephala]